ncbi:exonuclease domain-containing protein [Vicingaceae bacterium]|nr:exonuclease domain-containing protein [Vicingaceae bacterium]MDC1451517.1 exonuclease domain-containing protein [Vicingaceae bacterium]
MTLALKKPIVFFDLETTGVDVAKDRIVEISILKLYPDGKKEVKTRRVNPEMPIPKGSSEIHGIYDDDVKDEPTFKSMAKSLAVFIDNSDLAGFNSNKFDVPLLAEEFLRVGVDFEIDNRSLVDVQNIFHKLEQRTLVAAYKFYCGKDLTNAHSAEADNMATYEVLQAQIERYEELENNVNFLSEFSKRTNNADLMGRIVYNEEKVEVFNFGKHKGTPVSQVLERDPSYYKWMMNGDFPLYTKKVLTAIKLRSFNQ